MDGDIVRDFIEPLMRLGMMPKGDVAEIAAALAEDVPNATAHQLAHAARALRKTWRYQSFPTHRACLEAIEAAPIRDVVDAPQPSQRVERPRGDPPIVGEAVRFVRDYEAADAKGRAIFDRVNKGRYEASLAVARSYGAL